MSSVRIAFFAFLVAAHGAACVPRAVPDVLVPAGTAGESSDLALGAGDEFEVHVFNEPDLTGKYRVGNDGTIDFPLVGQVTVDGLEPHALAKLLEQKLGEKYLRSPQVSILITAQNSKKIVVLGMVGKPGSYPYTSSMTIMEAISVAGGVTPMAASSKTTITRIEAGHKRTNEVDVSEIGKGRAPNLLLRPGDIINVPERIF